MFPVGEFNFVVAGIATFAATVGYACSRRLSSSSSASESQAIRETLESTEKIVPRSLTQTDVVPTPQKLKRKVPHDGFDEPEKEPLGYPHNLANLYPNKRSRTPSTDSEATQNSTPVIVPVSQNFAPLVPDQDVEPVALNESVPIAIATPATEPPRTPSPVPEETSPKPPSPAPVPISTPVVEIPARTPSPAPIQAQEPLPAQVSTPSPAFAFRSTFTPLPVTPRFAAPKPFAFTSPSASGGFAAFAGSTSPFAGFNSKPKARESNSRSIWNTSDLESHQNDLNGQTDVLSDAFEPLKESHAIVEAKPTLLHPTEKYTHVTGEEDEDVELEQKGVKLYTKRGNKPFVDGAVGHIKLLSHKTTLEQRILFRREPLWKVSMNVRVNSSVRCTYVPEENVLRLILKEPIERPAAIESSTVDSPDDKSEVVIYALKPGRSCPKQDFKDFAEALVKNSHFKSTTKREDKASSP